MSDQSIIAVVALSLLFGLPAVVGGITIVVNHMHSAKRDEATAALKREMIERGFSADEIVRVIEAGAAETKTEDAEAS